MPGKPQFTRILRKFINRTKSLSSWSLLTWEDMESAIQELAECESFLCAYRLQLKEDSERTMVVDDEALDLYRTHFGAITTEEVNLTPPGPPATDLMAVLPAFQQLITESRDTCAHLLTLSKRVDAISAGSAPPRRAKNPQPQTNPPPHKKGAQPNSKPTYAQVASTPISDPETPSPPVTQKRQKIATGQSVGLQGPNTQTLEHGQSKQAPQTKRLPPITSKAKVPTVVITPQAPIAQNNPSYPPATMAALLRMAISQIHNPPQVSVTAAYVNWKGNIVVSFAPSISSTIVDNLVPLIGKTIMGLILHQAHHVVKQVALQICRVQ